MLPRPPRRTRPLVERLEDRAVPTTVVVSGGVLKITGTAGSEAVTFRTRDASHTQVLSGTTIIATIPKSTYTKVTASLLGGTDSFKIDASKGSPIPRGGVTLDGGTGNDTLVGPNATLLWKITGANAGTVSDGITFTNIENLAGGTGADHFKYAGGSFSGNIDGGGGSDLVDFSGISHPTTTASYPTFAGATNLKLNGSAAYANTGDGSVLRLTPNADNKAGSALLTRRVAVNAFSTSFAFRITHGTYSADGFTFLLARSGPAVLGADAGNLGYGGIGNSVAVEFDTYRNANFSDPSSNHVGIDVNGSMVSLATTNLTPKLTDGKLWHAWIDYDGTTLKVYAAESAVRPSQPVLSRAIDIPGYLDSEIGYAGFTGGTGGSGENNDIVSWNYTGALVADLSDGSITHVEDVAGSTGLDFLAGPNTKNDWYLTTGTSNVNKAVSFSLFDGLVGGSQNDYFHFQSGSILHSITGGAGADELNYSATATNVTVNLTSGAASRVGKRVLGIENVTGGAGNDTIIGDVHGNILSGGTGRDILIGGGGADQLDGGAGQDLLLGDSTSVNDLAAIAKEWQRTDADYATRVAHLRGTAGGGLNGSAFLKNANLVKDANAVDKLTGDPGNGPADTDWYLVSSEDKVSGFAAGEIKTVF